MVTRMRSHDEIFPNKAELADAARKDLLCPPPVCDACRLDVGVFAAPPGDEECFALWDRYAMPEHIRAHSLLVAQLASFLVEGVAAAGLHADFAAVRASALLHDLAKDYTIRYGGNHAQLGGAWVLEETHNPLVAQGVVHHVFWPWELDLAAFLLPLAVIYADKRVMHRDVVTLEDRFDDLFQRYGKTDYIVGRIEISRLQAVALEQTFSRYLGVDLHAYTFDRGRLVE